MLCIRIRIRIRIRILYFIHFIQFFNMYKLNIIPNTAVCGPTNFIETTTTASTARMKISKFGFLNLDF